MRGLLICFIVLIVAALVATTAAMNYTWDTWNTEETAISCRACFEGVQAYAVVPDAARVLKECDQTTAPCKTMNEIDERLANNNRPAFWRIL